ncbi:hypothetical protein ACQPX6_03305 [Actinomycetospora sp. CA-101289]|uniref:hypothetical protein n=1 Tax=Actinomycetospora sp. CA-101289 TaxID=3239893 RepID=UPI003D96CECC
MTTRCRHALVFLHVISSVSWMTAAAALAILLGLSRADPGATAAAVAVAHHLDLYLLAVAANASATTGFALAWTTPWGLLRHWWVAAKAAITLVQLYAGIAILSPVLDDLGHGAGPAPTALVAGTVAMAGAVAVQAFLSVAKPWGTTPVARRSRARPPRAPWPLPAAGVVAPLVDVGLTVALGFPAPLAEVVVLVVVAVARRRALVSRPVPTTASSARRR